MGIIGVRLLTHAAQIQQLFKVTDAAYFLIARISAGDRTSQPIKLYRIALQIRRIGHHALDVAAQHMTQIVLPGADKRLRTGNNGFFLVYIHRKNLVPLGERKRHQRRYRRYIDLERVNAKERLIGFNRQPATQRIQIQLLTGARKISHLLRRDKLQRM